MTSAKAIEDDGVVCGAAVELTAEADDSKRIKLCKIYGYQSVRSEFLNLFSPSDIIRVGLDAPGLQTARSNYEMHVSAQVCWETVKGNEHFEEVGLDCRII